MNDQAEAVQLYLMTPAGVAAGALDPLLTAALEAGHVACVLLDKAACDGDPAALAATVQLIQRHDAAALVPALDTAKRTGADGVHLNHPGEEAEAEIAAAIKQARGNGTGAGIVGAGALQTRHQAMDMGERDVDYVMFGEPDGNGGNDDGLPSVEAVLARVAWWAEIFTVPCVVYARTLDDIPALVAAGADFIALREAIWSDPRGVTAAMTQALEAIRRKRVEVA
ncbi:thiamine phosphate synthase [Roseiarcaceae bacterium H3SJ34-1]|uniref:thiamine phosphate synthase n=1 Tax=Terripilifer ovatus TaxID=3032367 RepID=UPI003AB939F1|nr:thiamine phosphate synthase [Roseiarcaceae bacterium H3SJ34-1]